jgi:hypothetical protein
VISSLAPDAAGSLLTYSPAGLLLMRREAPWREIEISLRLAAVV